jgi:hypothetical protein
MGENAATVSKVRHDLSDRVTGHAHGVQQKNE